MKRGQPPGIADIRPMEGAFPESSPLSDRDFAGLYIWQWHVKTNSFGWWSERCPYQNPIAHDCASGIDAFLLMVCERDRDGVAEDVTTTVSGTSTMRDVTLCPQNGETLRVRLNILPICDRSAQVISLLGLCYVDSALAELSWKRAVLLAQAEEIAGFGAWEFDVESRCGILSPHLARMLGIAPETRLSEDQYWKNVHPADRPTIVETVVSAVAAGAPFHYVARYFSPKRGTRHHLVSGFPTLHRSGRVESVVGIIFDFTDQNHADSELHRLSQKLLRARDDERRGIARELHESTGQTLAAVKMSLGRLREALPKADHRLEELRQSAVDLVENAIREVRTLSYLMHPPMLDEAGLRSAIQWYAKGFTDRCGIPVQVFIPEAFGRYGQEIETTLFRVVQEALTNIHRHSGSRTASIRLTAEDDVIHAVIQDDGCGLPSPEPALGRDLPPGVGIVGMRERVKQLNGTFEIYSAPGKGTTIRATLPLGTSSGRVRAAPRTRSRRS